MSRRWITAVLLCAAFAVSARPAAAQSTRRNCPVARDQLVQLFPGQSAAIRLDVVNLGEGTIALFQFPFGGTLVPTGPTPLDFVFIPDENFTGQASFTYRVIPSFLCSRGEIIMGRVTIAGGQVEPLPDIEDDDIDLLEELVGLGSPGLGADSLCGTGLFGLPIVLFVPGSIRRIRRHR